MIVVEIYAVHWEKHMELKIDEGITAAALSECIAGILGDENEEGYLISSTLRGIIPGNGRLDNYDIRTGSRLLYI